VVLAAAGEAQGEHAGNRDRRDVSDGCGGDGGGVHDDSYGVESSPGARLIETFLNHSGISPPLEWYRPGISLVDGASRRSQSRRMGIDVLGPLAVSGGERIGPRDRVVLEVLVVRGGEFVAPEVLADALWGDAVPPSWSKVVQGCVARLRKTLGPSAIETSDYGYRLVTHDDLLDARRFERMLARAQRHLSDGEADRAAFAATEALALWRGPPLPDVEEWEPGHVEAERLEGLRMDAQELRVEAEIAAGRSRAVLEDARTLVAEAPFREARWSLFARALYQSGRQTEALQVLQRARRMLLNELGLEPGVDLTALEESILRQDPALATAAVAEASAVCPYRGLLPYEAEDADAFFGRDDDVAAALLRLRERGVLAVVGASGVGKSSLVRAGIVAALRQEGVEVVVTTPGPRPLDSLAALPRRGSPVLVVDQAEEAVTLCQDPAEREQYLRALSDYAGPLVLALRADHLAELSRSTAFARLVESGLYLLSAPDEDHLRAAIEGPARHAGLRLEPGLVDLLIHEVSGAPGALPLLSHVLRQTWEHREGGTLTVDGYRATGGVRDAVARTAEALYEGLDERQRARLRALFMRLVTPSGDGEPVRARVSRAKIAVDPAHEHLVESLVAARLLSSDEGDLQIAHEALAREWPRLRGWLEEDIEGQRIFRHVATAAEEWEALDHPDSELYRGVRLAAALDWAATTRVELTATEREFLDASHAESERERATTAARLAQQRRSNRRLKFAFAGVALLLVASLVAGVLAIRERDHARGNEQRALTALASSDAHKMSLTASTQDDPTPALLLAVEANRLEDSPTTRDALLKVLVREPHLLRMTAQHWLKDPGAYADSSTSVSPDRTKLAISSFTSPGVTVVDTATGKVTATYAPPVGRVRFVGNGLLAVGVSTTHAGMAKVPLRLLNSRTLKEVPTQLGEQGPPAAIRTGLEVSGDGRYLAAGLEHVDDSGVFGAVQIRVWDVAHRGHPVFIGPAERFGEVLGVSDHRVYYAARGTRAIETYNITTHRRLAAVTLPNSDSFRLEVGALSPDGRTLAVTIGEEIMLVDTARMDVLRRWSNPDGAARAPQFSDDGSRLVTTTNTERSGFTVWNVSDGEILSSGGHIGGANPYAVFGPGQTMYLANDNAMSVWQLDRDEGIAPQTPTQPIGRNVGFDVASPDGHQMFYLDSAGAKLGNFLLQVLDTRTGRLKWSAQYPKVLGSNTGIWSPDGSTIIVTQGDRLRSFRAQNGRSFQGPDLRAGHIADVAWVAPGQLMTVSDDGTILLVDPADLSGQRVVAHARTSLWGIAPQMGRHRPVLVYTTDDLVYRVGLSSGQLTRLPVSKASGVVSPDGTRFVALGDDGTLGVYDLRDDRWIHRPSPSDATDVTFTSDGKHFLTTRGTSVTIWDRQGRKYATLDVPVAGIGEAGVYPPPGTGPLLLTTGTGELRHWSIHRRDWIAKACSMAGRNLTRDEWTTLVGNRPYHRTCPQYAAGS
jgi:DNA-binding SARP family transcriptional activator/WD40 repeat protein/energy-coupling factor transporter ATP-binding protein EcfA2